MNTLSLRYILNVYSGHKRKFKNLKISLSNNKSPRRLKTIQRIDHNQGCQMGQREGFSDTDIRKVCSLFVTRFKGLFRLESDAVSDQHIVQMHRIQAGWERWRVCWRKADHNPGISDMKQGNISIIINISNPATHHNDGQVQEPQMRGHPHILRHLGTRRRMQE